MSSLVSLLLLSEGGVLSVRRVLGDGDLLLAVRGEGDDLVRVGHVLRVISESDDLVLLVEELDTREGECSAWGVNQGLVD